MTKWEDNGKGKKVSKEVPGKVPYWYKVMEKNTDIDEVAVIYKAMQDAPVCALVFACARMRKYDFLFHVMTHCEVLCVYF